MTYSHQFLAMEATGRGQCQACGREIGVKNGVIAHHGYQRPFGWGEQTPSCFGARELPYEVSKDVLASHVDHCSARLTELYARIHDLQAQADGNVVIHWQGLSPIPGRRERVPQHIIVENQQHLDSVRDEMVKEQGRNALPWAYAGWLNKTYLDFKAQFLAELDLERQQRERHLDGLRQRLAAWVDPGFTPGPFYVETQRAKNKARA